MRTLPLQHPGIVFRLLVLGGALAAAGNTNDAPAPSASRAVAGRWVLIRRGDTPSAWRVGFPPGGEPRQAELTTGPADGRDGLTVRYDCSAGGRRLWIETHVTVERASALAFDLRCGNEANFFMRIMDDTGQQHMASVPVGTGAWQRIVMPLDPETFVHHWGGADDDVIHFPLKVIAVGVNAGSSPRGTFHLRDLAARQDDPARTWQARVTTDKPGHIHFIEEPGVAVSARILNRLDEPRTAPVALHITDLDGHTVTQQQARIAFAPWEVRTAE
ncbi:MAG: hypothetical protein JW951_00415, partial [Lentisphaerae bacterium]|nr:hypothetical protein [Lentisphaerota bacterium]